MSVDAHDGHDAQRTGGKEATGRGVVPGQCSQVSRDLVIGDG
jgi:hypothetical protein